MTLTGIVSGMTGSGAKVSKIWRQVEVIDQQSVVSSCEPQVCLQELCAKNGMTQRVGWAGWAGHDRI
jgi:hypothetical protein